MAVARERCTDNSLNGSHRSYGPRQRRSHFPQQWPSAIAPRRGSRRWTEPCSGAGCSNTNRPR
eukprot:8929778-Alexandrium_andersonii.AAC.1